MGATGQRLRGGAFSRPACRRRPQELGAPGFAERDRSTDPGAMCVYGAPAAQPPGRTRPMPRERHGCGTPRAAAPESAPY
eukprot:8727178-Alexandrium_andersonii.AAC.1